MADSNNEKLKQKVAAAEKGNAERDVPSFLDRPGETAIEATDQCPAFA